MCYKMGITAVIILLLITKRLMGQASNEPLLYRIYGCIDVLLLTYISFVSVLFDI